MKIYYKYLFLLLVFALLLSNCQNDSELRVPEKLGRLPLTGVISAEEAVAAKQNMIAEYGTEQKDLLYISQYTTASVAQEVFSLMIEKMMEGGNSPFTHIKALKAYKEKVYITLGMGAYHYIFCSDTYLLWLQTYQKFGREIPEAIRQIYPLTAVAGEQSDANL